MVRALRHNMSRHMFSILLFSILVVICYTCGLVYCNKTEQTKRVNLFVPFGTTVHKHISNDKIKREIMYFESPSLVASDDVMMAFAEVYRAYKEEENIDIIAKYIETNGKNWSEKVTESNGNNWKIELAIEKEIQTDCVTVLKNPIAVAKENKIYLLALKYIVPKNGEDDLKTTLYWGFEMAIGKVRRKNGRHGSKVIEWKPSLWTSADLAQQYKRRLLDTPPYGGSAFLTEDGKIIFIVRAMKENKEISFIIYLRYIEELATVELSYVESTEDCYSPFFFPWGNKLIMITHCQGGDYKVEESTDMGKTWTNSAESIARVWDNLKDKKDFTTATIENNKTVLLFTRLKIRGEGTSLRHEICLYVTDGNRVYNAGPIIRKDVKFVTSGGLVYTNGELFSLHQQWNNGPQNIFLTHLKDQMENIKSVLKIWTEKDKYLSKPWNETTPQGIFCLTPMLTDGLVGFLSNTTTKDNNNNLIWQDEYLYVNATVKRGTKVANGFMFSGIGSGAQFHGGRIYRFRKYGLTVFATVIIHAIPDIDTPLLTIGRINDEEPQGLWYTRNKQWKVVTPTVRGYVDGWDINKVYKVVLMLHNNSISAYVDGILLPTMRMKSSDDLLFEGNSLSIGRYMGDYKGISNIFSRMTVMNVFLYNRPFNYTHIRAMGRRVGDGDNLF